MSTWDKYVFSIIRKNNEGGEVYHDRKGRYRICANPL